MNPPISVIVPVYNEEDCLRKAVEGLESLIKPNFSKYEIIIIESGSTDNTAKISDQLKSKQIKVIHQNAKKGYGNALRLGFKLVKNELVWYYSADSPFDMNFLLDAVPLMKDADVVMAYRTGRRENLKRLIATTGYHILISTLLRVRVKDINFSFKLIKKEMVKKMDLKSNGWFIDAEIQAELRRHHARIKEIPVPYIMRKAGASKVNLRKDVPDMLKELMIYLFRRKR